MSFTLKNKTKREILFFNILQISYQEGKLTKEIIDDEKRYYEYKQNIYKQFERRDLFVRGYDNFIDVTHSLQNRDNIGQCLCSHCGLVYHHVIENKHTGETCWVGSECINNFLPHLEKESKKCIRKFNNEQTGDVCLYCDEGLTDMRLTYQRKRCCNYTCYKKYKYILPFGKFKGQNLLEFLFTERGQSWYKWAKNTLYEKPIAFHRYPLFKEILKQLEFE